jgi:hypothetical protein
MKFCKNYKYQYVYFYYGDSSVSESGYFEDSDWLPEKNDRILRDGLRTVGNPPFYLDAWYSDSEKKQYFRDGK